MTRYTLTLLEPSLLRELQYVLLSLSLTSEPHEDSPTTVFYWAFVFQLQLGREALGDIFRLAGVPWAYQKYETTYIRPPATRRALH